jgi:hypothetical protein
VLKPTPGISAAGVASAMQMTAPTVPAAAAAAGETVGAQKKQ